MIARADYKDAIGFATSLFGVVVPLLPLSDVWKWAVAFSLIALGLSIVIGPRIWALRGSAKVPMMEAATRAYEKTQNTIISEVAEREGEGLLTWYCWALWQRLPLFGERTPSRIVEHIPWSDKNLYSFKIEGSKIILKARSHERRFDDLHVKRADLKRAIQQLRYDVLGSEALFW